MVTKSRGRDKSTTVDVSGVQRCFLMETLSLELRTLSSDSYENFCSENLVHMTTFRRLLRKGPTSRNAPSFENMVGLLGLALACVPKSYASAIGERWRPFRMVRHFKSGQAAVPSPRTKDYTVERLGSEYVHVLHGTDKALNALLNEYALPATGYYINPNDADGTVAVLKNCERILDGEEFDGEESVVERMERFFTDKRKRRTTVKNPATNLTIRRITDDMMYLNLHVPAAEHLLYMDILKPLLVPTEPHVIPLADVKELMAAVAQVGTTRAQCLYDAFMVLFADASHLMTLIQDVHLDPVYLPNLTLGNHGFPGFSDGTSSRWRDRLNTPFADMPWLATMERILNGLGFDIYVLPRGESEAFDTEVEQVADALAGGG